MTTNANDLGVEQAELEQKLKELKQRQQYEEKKTRIVDQLDRAFGHRELYYVQEHDKIYAYDREWRGAPWVRFELRAFRNEHPVLRDADGWITFMGWLRDKNRYFYKVTYSFAEQPKSVLNLMRTEHWIKPSEGEPNVWYETLMLALGGGTTEGKDHIEQLLVWKYNNPDDFLLPCVNWYDEGGVGKNLFVEGIVGGIFGKEQVSSVGLDNVTGAFNSVIKGMTAVLLNEAANRKVDMEKLKNMIGQPDLYINEKGIPQYRVDNTPLYFIATNDPMSIPVEGRNSDRRWSIIHLQKSIEVFVAEELNCGEDDAKRLWVDQFADPLKEPQNLSIWLGHLLKRWSDIERPKPLHGEAYARAVSLRNEMNPMREALSLIESMDTWVPVTDLYAYTIGAPAFNKHTMWTDYKRFSAELSNEIKRRKIDLVFESEKKHWTRPNHFGDKKAASASIVRAANYHGPFTMNHFQYGAEPAPPKVGQSSLMVLDK